MSHFSQVGTGAASGFGQTSQSSFGGASIFANAPTTIVGSTRGRGQQLPSTRGRGGQNQQNTSMQQFSRGRGRGGQTTQVSQGAYKGRGGHSQLPSQSFPSHSMGHPQGPPHQQTQPNLGHANTQLFGQHKSQMIPSAISGHKGGNKTYLAPIQNDQSMTDVESTQKTHGAQKKALSLPPNKNKGFQNKHLICLNQSQTGQTLSQSQKKVPSALQPDFPHKPYIHASSQQFPSSGASLHQQNAPPQIKSSTPSFHQQQYKTSTEKKYPPKQAAPSKPASLGPDQDEEAPFEGDEYYDDEEYGEEEVSYGKEDEPEGESEKKVSHDMLEMLRAYKIKNPQAKDLCLHFVTDSCKFGSKCKQQHNATQKTQCLALVNHVKTTLGQKTMQKVDPKEDMIPAKITQEVKPPKNLNEKLLMMKQNEGATQQSKPVEESKESLSDNDSYELNQKIKQKLQEKNKSSLTIMPTFMPDPLPSEDDIDIPVITRIPSSTIKSDTIEQKRSKILQEFEIIQKQQSQFVIPGKAELVGMCPASEIEQRGNDVSSVNRFERDSRGSNFEKLSIKSYQRSAADKVMNAPANIRPPQILYKTVEYLRECIVDLDRLADQKMPYHWEKTPHINDLYGFVRDRVKSISKDFVTIDEPENLYFIKSLEEIIRFLICMTHDGISTQDFEMKQHIDIINANLTSLIKSYDITKLLYPNEQDPQRLSRLQNEAEFMSYHIINYSNNPIVGAKLINGLDIRTFPDSASQDLVRQAIRINLSIVNQSPPLYFRTLKRTNNYLFACLMLQFLNTSRKSLLDSLLKSIPARHELDMTFVREILLFQTNRNTETFAEACGYTKIDSKNHRISIEDKINDADQVVEKFKKWTQSDHLVFLDDLRGTQSRGHIMKHSPLESNGVRMRPIQHLIQKQLIAPQIPAPKPAPPVIVPPKPTGPTPEEIQKDAEKKRLQEVYRVEEQKKAEEDKKRLIQIEETKRIQKLQSDKEEKERKAKEEKENLERLQKQKIVDKFKKFVTKYRLSKLATVKSEFLSFFKQNRQLLGKKRLIRTFTQNLEEQLEEDYLEHSLQPLPDMELSRKVSSKYEQLCSSVKAPFQNEQSHFSFKTMVKEILKSQEGVLKVKLFTHPSNKEGSSSDVLNSLETDILTDHTKDKKVNFIFKSVNFESQSDKATLLAKADNLAQQMFGSNLIIVYSSMKSIQSDISKIKESLSLCPNYSRFVFLWIVHKIGDEAKRKINLGEDTIKTGLNHELLTEKISLLQVSTVYLSGQIPLISSKRSKLGKESAKHPVSIRNSVLAFILDDLEACLKKCSIYPAKSQNISIKPLYDMISSSLPELFELINPGQQQLPKVIRKFASIPNVSEVLSFNEIQILNFFLLCMQKQLEPIVSSLKNSISQITQQFKYSKFSLDTSTNFLTELNRITQLVQLKPLNCNVNANYGSLIKMIEERLSLCYTKLTLVQVCDGIKAFYAYDSSLVSAKLMNLFKGAKLFQIIVGPIFESINPEAYFIDNNFEPLSFSQLDFNSLKGTLQNGSQISEPPQPLAPSNGRVHVQNSVKGVVLGKRTLADTLAANIMQATSSDNLWNMKQEEEGKQSMEFAKMISNINEEEETRLESSAKRQKISQGIASRSTRESEMKEEDDYCFDEHQKQIAALTKFVEQKKKTGRPRKAY